MPHYRLRRKCALQRKRMRRAFSTEKVVHVRQVLFQEVEAAWVVQVHRLRAPFCYTVRRMRAASRDAKMKTNAPETRR